MKQHFLFKHYATRLLLVSFFALSAAVQVHAQAFDGDSDRKFFLGYTNVGGKNGVEFGIRKWYQRLLFLMVRNTLLLLIKRG